MKSLIYIIVVKLVLYCRPLCKAEPITTDVSLLNEDVRENMINEDVNSTLLENRNFNNAISTRGFGEKTTAITTPEPNDTVPKPQSITLTVKLQESNDVTFSWNKINNIRYDLKVIPIGSNYPIMFKSGISDWNYIVHHLPPCTEYSAIVTVNSSDWSISSEKVRFSTKTPDLDKIDITYQFMSPNSVNVSWKHETFHSNCPFQYTLFVNSSISESKFENISGLSYTLTGLEYDTEYSAAVKGIIRGPGGVKRKLSPKIKFRTLSEPTTTPTPVKNITVSSTGWQGNRLTITWTPIFGNNYIVKVLQGSNRSVRKLSDIKVPYVSITDLSPCQQYTLIVESYQQGVLTGESMPATINSWVPDFRNGEILDIVVTDTIVTVNWKAPQEANTCPDITYTLFWREANSSSVEEHSGNTENLTYRIQDLNPCTVYNIRLSANINDQLKQLDSRTVETSPSASEILTGFTVSKGFTDLRMKWNPRNFNNSCLQVYKLMFFEEGDPNRTVLLRYVNTTSWTESELIPCVKYTVWLYDTSFNSANASTSSPGVDGREIFPLKGAGEPANPDITIQAHSALIQWDISPAENRCRVNFRCEFRIATEDESWNTEIETKSNTCFIENLMSCTMYHFTITTITSFGFQRIIEPFSINRQTLAAPPMAPNAVTWSQEPGTVKPDSFLIKWRDPDNYDSKCEILKYQIKCANATSHTTISVRQIETKDCVRDEDFTCRYLFDEGLSPNTEYECFVWAVTAAGKGPTSFVRAKTLEKMASIIPFDVVAGLTNNMVISFSSVTVTLYGAMFMAINEEISQYYLVLSTNGEQYPPSTGTLNEMPAIYNYQHVYTSNPKILPYRTNEFSSIPEFEDALDTYPVSLGLDKNCTNVNRACNGPLRPDTNYALSLLVKNSWSYSLSSAVTFTTIEEPKKSVLLSVLLVVIVLIISLILIFIATKFRGKIKRAASKNRLFKNKKKKIFNKQETPGAKVLGVNEPLPPPVTIKLESCGLLAKCEEMLKNGGCQGAEEFASIKAQSVQYDCAVASMPCNRAKNRYKNILPYDHSRVKLQKVNNGLPEEEDECPDYINASFIPGPLCDKQFIACQGPTAATAEDFWEMVWEQNAGIIVMVTQCLEKGKNKCYQYWPEDVLVKEIGDFTIQKLTAKTNDYFALREFMLIRASEDCRRKLTQMHFTSWPDFGCPDQPDDLINFVSTVHTTKFVHNQGPLVVHCSAGVGRTGTFIALYSLMEELQLTQHVNLPSTVMKMRAYRVNMVQTEDQYIFLYKCLKAIVTNSWIRRSDSRGSKALGGSDDQYDERTPKYHTLYPNLRGDPLFPNMPSPLQNSSLMIEETDPNLTIHSYQNYL